MKFKDLLKNKAVMGILIALIVGVLSAVLGFDVKESICTEAPAAAEEPAKDAPAPTSPVMDEK